MLEIQLPTQEEIKSAYLKGEGAVIELVEILVMLNLALRDNVRVLEDKVQKLEDQLKKDSHNSGKPPTSDGLKKPLTHGMRHKSGRKSGGQFGHIGHRLEQVSNPDYIEIHPITKCKHCQASLEKVGVRAYKKRQVFDLPKIKLEVTEHQAEIKTCPECGKVNQAEFPANVSQKTQYGERIRSQAVYFHNYHFIPLKRTTEILEDLYQQPVTQGVVVAAVAETAKQVESTNEKIKSYLTQTEEAVCFDESGARVAAGKLNWLHSSSTKRASFYKIHAKRGSDAMDEIGILPKRTNWCVHDYWKAYLRYSQAKHSLCNAHVLRELTFLVEQYLQTWADEMIKLLLDIKQTVEVAKELGQETLSVEQIASFENHYDRIVAQGLLANPPPEETYEQPKKRGKVKQSKAKNLLDRLRDHRAKELAFMYDFKVPFDNNQAERDIRMTKLQQKVSGGFRSDDGSKSFCAVRSYVSTARKNNQPILDALYLALAGNPYSPAFLASYVAE